MKFIKTNIKFPLQGIIPPLPTPLINNDSLDLEGLEKLIDHVISGGVHGIFILGSTGEFAGLCYKLKYELIETACKLVRGRVPVLVGIADCSFTESIKLAKKAANSGADAVVTVPPFYFSASQVELLSYLKHLTQQLPLPLFLYNIPMHTKIEFAPETVKKAAEIPGIVGLKDTTFSSFYINRIKYLLKDKTDFTFLSGPEESLSEFFLTGGHGGVNGGANLFPKLYVGLYNAAKEGNLEKLKELQEKVIQINQTIYTIGNPESSYLRGIKSALSFLRICKDVMTEPFFSFNSAEKEQIKQSMIKLNYKELL